MPLKGRWRPPDRGRGGAPDCFCLGALALSCHSLPPQTPTPRGACPPGPFWGTTPPNPNPNPPGLLPPGSLLGYHPTQSQTPGRGMTVVLAKPFGGVASPRISPSPGPPSVPRHLVGIAPMGGPRSPWGRGGRRVVALESRDPPLPTPPMPGHLDVVEGLSLPARVRRMRARAGG